MTTPKNGKARATKPKAPKAKQTTIADWGPVSDPALDALADVYLEARQDFKECKEAMTEAKAKLKENMLSKQLTVYKTPTGYRVEIKGKDELTMTKEKAEE